MVVLEIILIIYGIITGLIFLIIIYLAISEWCESRKYNWDYFTGLFFIPALLYSYISNYISDVWETGGIRKYYRDKKEYEEQIKRLKAENKRIVKFYDENGNILRYKMPRTLDGIKQFEFNSNLTNKSGRDYIYIENAYNKVFNDFFKRHGHLRIIYGITVWYIPKLVEELAKEEIVRYINPEGGFGLAKISNITTDCLLADLAYPEDAEKLKHGIISLDSLEHNSYDVEYTKATYFPLEEGDDAYILSQIEAFVKEKNDIQIDLESNYDIHHNLSIEKNDEIDEEYADANFNNQLYDDNIAILKDEVREKIKGLRQYGISENILMKMIQVKPKLSRLVITKDFRIILPDYDNMEIKMEPLLKAVYLLFLRNKDGIIFENLPAYEYALFRIYISLVPNWQNENILKDIDDVCNPCLNSINEKCARIRGAFISQFDESLAKNYFINGDWGQPKKIVLPRDLVIWEGKL